MSVTTAAQAVQLGPAGFDDWIEEQVYPARRRRRKALHRASTAAERWFTGQRAALPRRAVIAGTLITIVLITGATTRGR